MTFAEAKNTTILALIFALRMLGLFMVLPVLALYVDKIEGATLGLLGLAAGIYGLTQALCQIPFGILSDHYGRKRVIGAGLVLFALGSLVAATSSGIWGLIIGRAMQGMGAIGAPVLALVADLTREQVRSQAMAIIGISIGLTFVLAILLGPMLNAVIGLSGIFIITAVFALLALLLISLVNVEDAPRKKSALRLRQPESWGLHINVFILHAMLTMSFLVLPVKIEEIAGFDSGSAWRFYLPVLGVSLLVVAPLLRIIDKVAQPARLLMLAVVCLGIAIHVLLQANSYYWFMGAAVAFFVAFNFLEASLPAMVSKLASPEQKGSSMGFYSFAQFMGMFAGGALGGLTLESTGRVGVSMGCIALTVLALLVLQKSRRQIWQKV